MVFVVASLASVSSCWFFRHAIMSFYCTCDYTLSLLFATLHCCYLDQGSLEKEILLSQWDSFGYKKLGQLPQGRQKHHHSPKTASPNPRHSISTGRRICMETHTLPSKTHSVPLARSSQTTVQNRQERSTAMPTEISTPAHRLSN